MSADRLLVIVEDDDAFARTLKRSFERRGYQVATAASHEELGTLLDTCRPHYAVVDLKLGGGASGGEWRGSTEVVQTRGDGSRVAVRTRWGWRLLDPWHGTAVTRGWLQVVASTI